MAPAGELLRQAPTRLIGECALFQVPEASLLVTQLLFRPQGAASIARKLLMRGDRNETIGPKRDSSES